MATIQLLVDDEQIDLDLSVDRMTLIEHERLQKEIGTRRWSAFFQSGAIALEPDFLRAFLFAKVKSIVTSATIDDIDVDFVSLLEQLNQLQEEAEGKALESS